MENLTPLILVAGGLVLGFLLKLGARGAGGDVDTGNLDGIDSIQQAESERLKAERRSLNSDRAIIEADRDEVRLAGERIKREREFIERERSVNDRDAKLLAELKRRVDEEKE